MDEMSLCLLSPFSILMIPKAFKKTEIYLFQIKLSTMSTSFHKYCPEMHMKKYNIHKLFSTKLTTSIKSNCFISRIIVTWYMEIIMEEHK